MLALADLTLANGVTRTTRMAQGVEQYRLALSVYPEPKDLWRTVFLLLEAGLTSDQICLVARGNAIGAFAPVPTIVDGRHDQLAALHGRLGNRCIIPDATDIVTTTAPLLQILLDVQRRDSGAIETALTSSSCKSDVLSHVRNGAVALIVRSPDAAGQLLTTQTLLGTATMTVSTYELVVPSGDD